MIERMHSVRPTEDRPLRRDAQRNVERIRTAASALFRERGLAISHEAIAREADVSVGTIYRRFPSKDDLIEAVFEEELDAVVALAEAAAGLDDPWESFVRLIHDVAERTADDAGLQQLITGSVHGAGRTKRVRERLEPLASAVVARAIGAGALRPDAEPQDIPMVHLMLAPLLEASRAVGQELWRRYLIIVLDGLRAEGHPREHMPPAVSADDLERVITGPARC